MYFTEEVLRQITADMEELICRYKNRYYDLKNAVDASAEYETIWAEGHTEPHREDYIFDFEIKGCERKIFKSEPKKKAFRSKHFYKNDQPVYSVCFDNYGDPAIEEFFVYENTSLICALFSLRDGKLIELYETIYDEEHRPAEYRFADLHRYSVPVIDCCVYFYEGEHIVSAEVMRELNTAEKIMMYDDPLYENWRGRDIEYMLSTPFMNPKAVYTYEFIYGESDFPEEFARTEYSHCTVTTGQWKTGKAILKGFSQCGVKYFNK